MSHVHTKYIGPIAHLREKTALLRSVKGDAKHVLAQFDDVTLKEAFGWHEFSSDSFANHCTCAELRMMTSRDMSHFSGCPLYREK